MSTTPRSRHAARLRAHRRRAQARARWLVLGVAVAVLLSVTFAVTAFSGEESATGPVRTMRTNAPVTTTRPGAARPRDGREPSHPVARRPGRRHDGRLPRLGRGSARAPAGRTAGERGPARAALAPDHRLGAPRASLVPARERLAARRSTSAPCRGRTSTRRSTGPSSRSATTSSSGRSAGSEIELRPSSAPSLVVALQHIDTDPALSVGQNVAAGSSKLGTVVDITKLEQQSLCALLGRQRRERRHPGVPVGDARRPVDRRPSADPLRRRRRGHARARTRSRNASPACAPSSGSTRAS